jgi:hypothetical protein
MLVCVVFGLLLITLGEWQQSLLRAEAAAFPTSWLPKFFFSPSSNATLTTNHKSKSEEHRNMVCMYKIDESCELCGEVQLPSICSSFARSIGRMELGTCATQGFTKFHHVEEIQLGPFGIFEVKIFSKALFGEESIDGVKRDLPGSRIKLGLTKILKRCQEGVRLDWSKIFSIPPVP